MTREEVFVQLNGVFRDVFDDGDIVVTDKTTASDIEGWDSLMHISLISAVEDEFDIKFSMKEVVNMENVGEMADIIVRELEG
ncbi:MAG: acyl carrier protein [Lachnospiraceae bacterium]|nr:acyl carrier protein [Lachnospiraceae bacterium]